MLEDQNQHLVEQGVKSNLANFGFVGKQYLKSDVGSKCKVVEGTHQWISFRKVKNKSCV